MCQVVWAIPKQFWGNSVSGAILGQFWGHSVSILGQFWVNSVSGAILEQFCLNLVSGVLVFGALGVRFLELWGLVF